MKEVWKEIPGYAGDYQVSDHGRVKSLKGSEEKILKLSKDSRGYFCETYNADNLQTLGFDQEMVQDNPIIIRSYNDQSSNLSNVQK